MRSGFCKGAVFTLCASAASASAWPDTATFSLHRTMDPQMAGQVAFTHLVPKGWLADDVVKWQLGQRTAPLEYGVRVVSADGSSEILNLNVLMNVYNRAPNGSSKNVPPSSPEDLVRIELGTSFRGVDAQIIERKVTPRKSIFPLFGATTGGAYDYSARFRFKWRGVPMIAKESFTYDGYDVGTPWGRAHGWSHGSWFVSNWTAVTAPENAFDRTLKMGGVVLSSFRMDPSFFQKYSDVLKFEGGIIRAQGQALLNSHRSLSASNKDAFEADMAAHDRHTRDFCDMVLNQDRYTDGTTEFILPRGYTHAATDGTYYAVTSDPMFSVSGRWHELRREH